MTESQCTEILRHLKKRKTITPLEALRLFGSFRLGARIYDLKRRGHVISRRMIEVGEKSVAEYRLEKAA